MNLYLLTQSENTGYDTYDSCVVTAATADEAKQIHPTGDIYGDKSCRWNSWDSDWGPTWAKSPDNVNCTLLGTAVPDVKCGVLLASFNAG